MTKLNSKMNQEYASTWCSKNTIIGLSPMDGYTDYAFRETLCHFSKPDVVFTEFVPASGLIKKSTAFEEELRFDNHEVPVVIQLFGSNPEHFYKAIIFLKDRGFAGIDLNMGCPAKNINHVGAGASLINSPQLAQEIILASREAINKALPKNFPLSVKTRIGISSNTIEEWLPILAHCPIDAITLHGRTLKQAYTGLADWDIIQRGRDIVKNINPHITFLGNGDIKDIQQARNYITKYSLDGVLVGRSTFGNPWFFSGHQATIQEKAECAIYHAEMLEKCHNKNLFIRLRKHLIHYFKGIECASNIRSELVSVNNAADVKAIAAKYIK